MNEFCVNHPDRPCAVIIHDVSTGVHKRTPYCLDCAAEAGDTTALMLRHQSQVFDFMNEALQPTPLGSERVN